MKLKIFSNRCITDPVSQKYKTVGVSFPKADLPLLAEAKAKAKAKRWSFSNYVCSLIQADLDRAGRPEGMDLRETSSAKIQLAADAHTDSAIYKIRSRRKPAP